MKNQRPIIALRTCRSITRRLPSAKRRFSRSSVWKVFTSSTPLICSVSCMCAASAPICSCSRCRTR